MPRSLFSWLFTRATEVLDRSVGWHKLPLLPGIAVLIGLRTRLRQRNLHDTSSSSPRLIETGTQGLSPGKFVPKNTRRITARTPDGTFDDLENPATGSAGTHFGRNVPLEHTHPENVGLFAEPEPEGYGFSDTAFRIFVLMASRRLNSDRFFTTDYTPEVYTQAGLDWIDANDMSSVLRRNFPALESTLRGVKNAFAPWPTVSP